MARSSHLMPRGCDSGAVTKSGRILSPDSSRRVGGTFTPRPVFVNGAAWGAGNQGNRAGRVVAAGEAKPSAAWNAVEQPADSCAPVLGNHPNPPGSGRNL